MDSFGGIVSIALAVITDGRKDCIAQTIPSALRHLQGPITYKVIYDDTGDEQHRQWLRETFPDFELIWHPDGRQGFGGAIRTMWAHLATRPEEFIFATEDDFRFYRYVDLEVIMKVLRGSPRLTQMALRRQPWNPAEFAAGGVVEQRPESYFDHYMHPGHMWLEHRLFWTTNPSLFRRSLIDEGWPEGEQSEGRFCAKLMKAHPNWLFGYWGGRDEGEWVQHIGQQRVGTGY